MSDAKQVSFAESMRPYFVWLQDLGRYTLFSWESLLWVFRRPYRVRLMIEDMEFIGNQSLFIVALSGFFTGAVFAYQSWVGFHVVGTDSLVGAVVGQALCRELGPVMTGIVVTGRAGAAMAAKLGIMRVTQQIDAMEIMAVSPKQYLVGPKLIAATASLPMLTAFFCLIGNLGAYLTAVYVCGVDSAIYIQKLKFYLTPMDFYHGLIKAACFGFMIASISCFKGYTAKRGAEGVGYATNSAVVFGIITILVMDYFLSVIIPTGLRHQ